MSAAARLHTAAPAHLPLIAVTTSEMRQNTLDLATDQADPPRHEMVLGMRYLEAVGRAGALAIVVPPMPGPAIPALLDRVDGICLSGGPDLHPDAYGATPHAELGPTEPRLDAFELALARAADERDMPILAICRGMQVLNVARGGTLHQHLPDVVGETVAHRQQGNPSRPTHGVSVAGDSRLMPAVPQEAVVYEGAQARVWVARPSSKSVVTRPIEVGATTNGLVEVRKGLNVGETVVASGTLFIDRAATRD